MPTAPVPVPTEKPDGNGSSGTVQQKLSDGTVEIKEINKEGKVISTKYQTKDGIYLLKKNNTLCYLKENQSLVRSKKSVTIKDKTTIAGKTRKITEIEKGAFRGMKKLKNVTIGRNIAAIGDNAFQGCGSLAQITIRSGKLEKIGKNAIKGVHKNVQIICPKGKAKSYQKLFGKKTGFVKKTMKIK